MVVAQDELAIVDFGLLNDTGAYDSDHRTDDPTLAGTLAGLQLTADHFDIEFALNAVDGAGEYLLDPVADATLTIDSTRH